MNTEDFIFEARKILNPILGEKGCVLYSSISTLRPGPIYVMGLNPGGNPSDDETTIGRSLETLPKYRDNSYLDESWSNHKKYEKGKHPIQKNMRTLADVLGYDLRQICASNLIFLKSKDAHGSRFYELADLCWRVHRLILDIIQPSTLIVFGIDNISPYSYLTKKIADKEPVSFPSGHGKLSCYAFNAEDETRHFKVIALPHFSRYSLAGKHDVIEWLKRENILHVC